jgi:hypothetical protein
MLQKPKEYKMTISRTTIDKLGIKLYDSPSAVVSELIANSYDADAENVEVEIPLDKWLATVQNGKVVDKGFEIVIRDDGIGMNPDVINDFYLRIGTDPRKDPKRGPRTLEKKRLRIGRKGIGKLAPFGICKKIEVITAGGTKTPKGYEVAHFILDYEDINQETDQDYFPEIGKLNRRFSKKRGTTVRLFNFHHRRTPDAETFHRQVARRFGLEQKDFKITVKDTSTGNCFDIGELAVEIDEDTKIVVDDRPVKLDDGTELPVRGWVAYSKHPYPNEEVSGIRIYARGKFVSNAGIFGLRSGFTGEYTIRSYIVGVIHADWIDSDDHEDLIRSDRQDILWSSEWGEAFKRWGQELVKELGKTAYPAKKRKVADRFLEVSELQKEAEKRFEDEEVRKTALEVGRILGRGLNEENLNDMEYVKNVRELALSIAPHKTIVDKLKEAEALIDERPLEAIAKLFNDAKLAESASLGMIARERIDAITKLKTILDTATEHDLQKLLESAPWIIDPRWTMLQANKTFNSFRERFEKWYENKYKVKILTTTENSDGTRPDFIMLHVGRNVEIVEIKKKGHKLQNDEFAKIEDYYDRIMEYLGNNPSFKEQFPKAHVTLICDDLNLDKTHQRAYDLISNQGNLVKKTWDELLTDAETVNRDFLEISRYKTAR